MGCNCKKVRRVPTKPKPEENKEQEKKGNE